MLGQLTQLQINIQNRIFIVSKLYNPDYVYGGDKIFSVGDLVRWLVWAENEGRMVSKKKIGVILGIEVSEHEGREVAYANILPMNGDAGNIIKKVLTTIYLVSKGDNEGHA